MTIVLVSMAAFATIAFLNWLHAKERQTLLDRIQAPREVIAQRITHSEPLVKAVHPNDDEDYWDAQGVDLPETPGLEVPH